MNFDKLPNEIAEFLTPEPNTGCWLYVGPDSGVNRNGYARRMFWVGEPGKRKRQWKMLHREVWEFFFGPIPPELVLDHHCRVRLCSNPFEHNGGQHEVVTVQVNTRRGEAVLFAKLEEENAG